MEKQFDKAFLELIDAGDRRNLATYRNCIIEEEQRREMHQDLNSIKKSYEDTMEVYRGTRNLYALYMAVDILLIIACIVLVMFDISKGFYITAVVMTVIGVVNSMSLVKSIARFRFYQYVYQQFKGGRVVVARAKTEGEMTFPDIFGVISRDTEEVLRHKKAKLDEILGL